MLIWILTWAGLLVGLLYIPTDKDEIQKVFDSSTDYLYLLQKSATYQSPSTIVIMSLKPPMMSLNGKIKTISTVSNSLKQRYTTSKSYINLPLNHSSVKKLKYVVSSDINSNPKSLGLQVLSSKIKMHKPEGTRYFGGNEINNISQNRGHTFAYQQINNNFSYLPIFGSSVSQLSNHNTNIGMINDSTLYMADLPSQSVGGLVDPGDLDPGVDNLVPVSDGTVYLYVLILFYAVFRLKLFHKA